MQSHANTKEDPAFELIIPLAPWRVKSVQAEDDYVLSLEFNDGLSGKADLKNLIEYGIFQKLKDKSKFKQVYLSYGAVTWDGEIDLSPTDLYDNIKKLGCYTPTGFTPPVNQSITSMV